MKHFCEIILKSDHWLGGDVFERFSSFSSGGNSVQRSGTILAIVVEGHKMNISVKLF